MKKFSATKLTVALVVCALAPSFAVRGCRDPFLLPHRTPGTGWTYRRFGHLELFVSDPPGANDPLGTSLFLIQNDSGLSQGPAHYSAAG